MGAMPLLVGPTGMHDDYETSLDGKIHMRLIFMQNLESIRWFEGIILL